VNGQGSATAAAAPRPRPRAHSLDRPESSLYNRRALTPRSLGAQGAQVAQLVEHCTENAGVGGSIPPLGTNTLENRDRTCLLLTAS
jgi:hypothetical protein